MQREAFRDLIYAPKPVRPFRADAYSAGDELTEVEPDEIAGEDYQGGSDTPESVPAEADPATNEPTEEQVRNRAYEICQARRGAPGDPVADWLQAEQELRARLRLQAT